MTDFSEWVNICDYAGNGNLQEEIDYFKRFGKHTSYTYLPRDAPLEQYLSDLRNAVETGIPIVSICADFIGMPEDALY